MKNYSNNPNDSEYLELNVTSYNYNFVETSNCDF